MAKLNKKELKELKEAQELEAEVVEKVLIFDTPEQEIEHLKKELERANRTNKLLRKKLKRLRLREETLVSEIDEMDAVTAIEHEVTYLEEHVCPVCGGRLNYVDLPHGQLETCGTLNCLHKRVIKW